MAELRRLFIDKQRLKVLCGENKILRLLKDESHYLNRVLRLKKSDKVQIVDGIGHLWEAKIFSNELLTVTTSFDDPIENNLRPKPLICLSVVVPKNGFEEVLRMSCEIGVDVIQPLLSARSVAKMESKTRNIRWEKILREAVEQSERLWAPEIKKILSFDNWLAETSSSSSLSIASTRLSNVEDLHSWLDNIKKDTDSVWVAIGPEGGWTSQEEIIAKDFGCKSVDLGDNILRTSTAAVSACQLIASWRRRKSFGWSNI
tara:strand:- start:163 stop:939 length:777 start_codon:yes stop_codon:yes gene_type:complete